MKFCFNKVFWKPELYNDIPKLKSFMYECTKMELKRTESDKFQYERNFFGMLFFM